MPDDLNIMIELQGCWNNVMALESEIERSRKSIKLWESRNRELSARTAETESAYKNLTLKIKQDELELSGIESKIEKSESRRNLLKSERELEALNSELEKLCEDKDRLETAVFTLMEKGDELKLSLDRLKEELAESNIQTVKDIEGLNRKIESLNGEVSEKKKNFNTLKETLSSAVKSRFEKLINSKDGIAISRLNGEICTHCNFQVPSSVASVVSKTALSTCTNCGRYLY